MPRTSLSAADARRIAIAAQGLDRDDWPARVDLRHLRRELGRIGVLQLDFVNVLVPAHRLVLYSRIGAHDEAAFRRAVYERREFMEQWAHEASIVPVEAWPLLGYRRKRYRPYPNNPLNKLRNKNKYLEQCIEIVRNKGPVTTQDMPPAPTARRRPGDWHRSLPRWALEYHFGSGNVVACDRLPNFQRVYDLPERVLPGDHGESVVDEQEARRRLLAQAARALGVATTSDLADYYRMSLREARPRIEELVEQGELEPASVEGWNEPAWLAPGTRLPRRVTRKTLLSPFDPLVWYRPRAERLFGFHYRIEIYVPADRRRWGYYVLPFLSGDALTARADLKANRREGTLEVRAAWLEDGVNEMACAQELADELRRVADWLGLERIAVHRRGNLARRLGRSVSRRSAPGV